MVIGAVLGLMVGQGATIILSRILTARTDILIEAPLAWPEFHFVAGFVTLASLLALGPAAILTRKPIVTALRS
jgi:putative ABC transport system permease protein